MSGTTTDDPAIREASIVVHEFWKDYAPDGHGGIKEIHKVKWSKRGDVFYNAQTEEIARMMKPIREEGGAEYFHPKWVVIRPAYEAWLQGQEAPVDGTPLDAWAGITKREAKEFIAAGYRSVEDIAALTDGNIPKIRLPNVRKTRDGARAFVEHKKGGAHIEAALASRDETIQQLQAQLAELAASNGDMAEALKKLMPKPEKAEAA